MGCRFLTVDVFTSEAFEGAQIAVVPNAEHLSDINMQKIAAELSVWRTVFILPSSNEQNAQAIRIFNQQREFDFGGHATIAAIHALGVLNKKALSEGENEFILEEKYGDVTCTVNMQNDKPVFHQFTSQTKVEIDRFTPTLQELSEFLSIKSYHFDVKNFNPLLVASHVPYLFVPVDNYASLSSVHFDYKAWTASSAPSNFASSIFLFSVSENNGQAHFHCRLVGPDIGLHEDPPIGAAMPAFAAYLKQFPIASQLPLKFIAERGAFAGRKSELHVEIIAADNHTVTVKIGGEAVLVSQGEMYF